MKKQTQKRQSVTVPPSPYDFEETVRRILKAPPMPKKKPSSRIKRKISTGGSNG